MQALVIIDAQNEFSRYGKRSVPNFGEAINAISRHVDRFRQKRWPIAWVRHFNQPHESPAFMPGTWGAEFASGLGPQEGPGKEKEFQKNVYGAFSGSDIENWLRQQNIDELLIVGFFTHGCVSTTSREAIMAGLSVVLDIQSTGTCDIVDPLLGMLTADEVKRSALLQLVQMGARVIDSKDEPALITR